MKKVFAKFLNTDFLCRRKSFIEDMKSKGVPISRQLLEVTTAVLSSNVDPMINLIYVLLFSVTGYRIESIMVYVLETMEGCGIALGARGFARLGFAKTYLVILSHNSSFLLVLLPTYPSFSGLLIIPLSISF